MELGVLVTAGLGDNSYLLASGDEAALVDPQRDSVRTLRLGEPGAPGSATSSRPTSTTTTSRARSTRPTPREPMW